MCRIIQDNFLFQHVVHPTRYREGVSPSVLDLILTNEEGMIRNLVYRSGLGKSDHAILRFSLTCYSPPLVSRANKLNYNRGRYEDANVILSEVDWQHLEDLPLAEGYAFFLSIIAKTANLCIPRARPEVKAKNIYMDSAALNLKKQKEELWGTYRQSGEALDLARFRRCRNQLRNRTRYLRRSLEEGLVHGMKNNPKSFWRYVRSRLNTRSGIEDLRDEMGNIANDNVSKATLLNRFLPALTQRTRMMSLNHESSLTDRKSMI